MPHPENVIGKGNRFSKDNQPANRGRKPRLYTIAKQTENIGWDEFKDVMMMLMNSTKDELKAIMDAPDTPVWVVNVARAVWKDTGRGKLDALRELMDRTYGKVPQRTDVSLSASPEDVGGLPTEALLRMHEIAQQAKAGAAAGSTTPPADEKAAERTKMAKKKE